jgi:hypothetical protein
MYIKIGFGFFKLLFNQSLMLRNRITFHTYVSKKIKTNRYEKNNSYILQFFAFNSIFGQTNEEKYAEDVKSVDAIINAYYDVVSGPMVSLRI